MKNTKLFQYVLIGVFVFFIIIGAIMFATYRSTSQSTADINISVWGTLSADNFESFVNRYFNDTEIKSQVEYKEVEIADFDKELVEALASGVGPDAVILPEDLIVRYRNKVYPIPYTTLPELTFKQTYIQEGELYLNNQGIIALPFSLDPLVMYWNRDIFNNIGVTKPPVSWTEISSLIPKITQKDSAQNISRSTVALGEFRNINNAKEILSALIMQAGNPIVSLNLGDDSLTSVLDSDLNLSSLPTSAALQFYTNFSNPVKKEYTWNRALPSSLDAFANGDLAIYFGFSSEYVKIKNKNPNLNFDVALLPQAQGAKTYSTFGNMLGLAIMKNSANPAGTYSIISALASAQAVPFWQDLFNVPSARRDVLSQNEKNAVKTIFNKSAIMSRGWLDPDGIKTGTIFQEMVESYTTGRSTLDEAVITASARLDSLLNNK
ncbi:MAG: extracellular solute-binding protein [Candidatus Paceibacterota bacterium]